MTKTWLEIIKPSDTWKETCLTLWSSLCTACWWPSTINSLGPSDFYIWHCRSWSTLVQVMACCLTAPSHYLNQCWLIISKVLWHSSEDIIIRFEDTNQYSKIEYYIFEITLRSPRGQWVKCQDICKKSDDKVWVSQIGGSALDGVNFQIWDQVKLHCWMTRFHDCIWLYHWILEQHFLKQQALSTCTCLPNLQGNNNQRSVMRNTQ